VQEGQTCNPRCYYSTPKCLQPSKSCSPTTQTTNNNSNTQIANPASVNCIDQNGTLEIVDTNEGQVGICTLPNGHVCEEWALFRGECS
jgi:putative hemolysin